MLRNSAFVVELVRFNVCSGYQEQRVNPMNGFPQWRWHLDEIYVILVNRQLVNLSKHVGRNWFCSSASAVRKN